MSRGEHLYIIAYDIADQKRWRRVYKTLRGYGSWVQLSVFQLRLSDRRHRELMGNLEGIINHQEDHIICFDLGPADGKKEPRVTSLGRSFSFLERDAVIV